MKYILPTLLLVSFNVLAQSISTDKNAIIHSQFRVQTTNETDGSDPTKATITIQYVDGSGRPLQTVGYQASPTRKDIISGDINYDQYNRVTQTILPTPTNVQSGAYQASLISSAQSFYNDNKPYASTYQFDNSPLNRPRWQYGAGQVWLNNSKYVQTYDEYAGTDVKFYYLDAGKNIVLQGTYPPKSLYKKRIIDEQGHTSIIFTDLRGRLIQQQEQDNTDYQTTYYLYDGLGRITAIIQPEGYKLNQTLNYNSTEFNNWVFYYEYDYRGRNDLKKVAGVNFADAEYRVYDKFDRVVLSQNGMQRGYNRWTFYKYDGLNRLIIEGELTNARNLTQFETDVQANANNRFESRNQSSPVYYTYNQTYPAWIAESNIRQVNYYDNYNDWRPVDMAFDAFNAYHSLYNEAQGSITGSRTRYTENNTWLTSVTYYNNKDRVIQVFAHNLYGQTERTDFQYNFAGQLLTTRSMMKDGSGTIRTQTEQQIYDHVGRLLTYQVAVNATPTEVACSHNYDEVGREKTRIFYPNRQYRQLPTTNDYIYRPPNPTPQTQDIAGRAIVLQAGTLIQGNTLTSYLAQIIPNSLSNNIVQGLQTLNYDYQIRGALSCINCTNGQPTLNTAENDIFANKLDLETTGNYDGNIGKQTWINKSDNLQRVYTYSYDVAKRLTAATFSGGRSGENYSLPTLTYDKNGNIQTLMRNGNVGNGFGAIDNLAYTYSGNRLMKVEDAVSGNADVGDFRNGNVGSNDYTYWGDGSLQSDANKGIGWIDYDTFLGKPTQINYNDGRRTNFFYDSIGDKLKQTTSVGDELHYAGKAIYQKKNNVTSLLQIAQQEGRIIFINNTYVLDFAIKDHLGSLRASLRDSLPVTVGGVNLPPVLTNFTDYDPWGWRLPIGQVGTNNFTFQGNEKINSFGYNMLDFGNRQYDATLGRMTAIDRYVEKYPNLTGFQFAANNPLRFIDVNGDSLQYNVGNSTTATAKVEAVINKGLGGFYTANTDKNGKVTLIATNQKGNMSIQQQNFLKIMSGIISDSKTTTINVAESSRE